MSEENVEILNRAYAALNRGDLDAVLGICDPEIECRLPEGGLNTGTHRGLQELRGLLEGYTDTFEPFRAEPERIVSADDQVVVFLRMSGEGRGSGVAVDLRPAHVWTLRNGKVIRLQVFPRGEGALEAAGLSE
jgi:uncharacterized protein